jgi:hypothetical protein
MESRVGMTFDDAPIERLTTAGRAEEVEIKYQYLHRRSLTMRFPAVAARPLAGSVTPPFRGAPVVIFNSHNQETNEH